MESSNSDLIFNPDDTTKKLKSLNLTEDCRDIINSYDKFFNSKKRKNDFKLFDIDKKTPSNIDYIITSILLGIKSINDEDILKNIIKLYYEDSNIDENNKPCRYLLHFEDENGNKVSDECTIIANYKNTEVKDRFFREKFVFKNIEYDRNKTYYLIIREEDTGIELPRIKFYIDISMANIFDF